LESRPAANDFHTPNRPRLH